MELNLLLLKDYDYNVTNDSIPIILKLTSNTEIKLTSKWDIRRITLSKNVEEINGFSSTPALGIHKGFWTISKDKPKYLVIDLNYYKDIMAPIVPDEYQINIVIILYEVIDEKYKIHELQSYTNISLK